VNECGVSFSVEVLDRHELEGDNDPATIAEINELRAARGKPPLPMLLGER
jgi:hypothetical protein